VRNEHEQEQGQHQAGAGEKLQERGHIRQERGPWGEHRHGLLCRRGGRLVLRELSGELVYRLLDFLEHASPTGIPQIVDLLFQVARVARQLVGQARELRHDPPAAATDHQGHQQHHQDRCWRAAKALTVDRGHDRLQEKGQ
jgi:hypothetical protein